MLCFSVDSRDSLENVESKWVGEIAENCAGVKLVLVALKCDLRESGEDHEDDGTTGGQGHKSTIDYKMGLEVAKRISALRYLGRLRPRKIRTAPRKKRREGTCSKSTSLSRRSEFEHST